MKVAQFANLAVAGLVLCIAATGCQKKPGYMTHIKQPGMTGSGSGTGDTADNTKGLTGGDKPINTSDIDPSKLRQPDPTNHLGWVEDPATLSGDTVHFAFDSSVVRNEEKSKLAAVVDYLKANPANAVRIEGYCDERGTEEYNRSLGERRALALREELVLRQAIDPNRVETISFGKDRPVDPGHDEAAHAKNRRGVFIVLTPPK